MAIFETVLKSDLKKPVQVKQLSGNLFSGDNQGNKITVEVMDNGSPATLSGGVTGYVLREDNSTVIISSGTLSGNKASIVLPEEAYNIIGRVSIVVKVGTTTVGACTAFVYRTSTDTLVDPTGAIPSIQELLAKISACEQATADANKVANLTVSAEAATGSTPDAVLSETGSPAHKHITFKLVKGDKGDTGDTGATPQLSIGTVTTLQPSQDATVTITGTDEEPVLNFGIPQGASGNETIDDTAGIGDTDLVYSADKVRKELDTKAPVVDVPLTTPASVQSFPDGADGLPMALTVGIEPVQDLHGQDSPYPAGGGKNLFVNSNTTYNGNGHVVSNQPVAKELTGAYYVSFDYKVTTVSGNSQTLIYGYLDGSQVSGNVANFTDSTVSSDWIHYSKQISSSITFDAINIYSNNTMQIKNIMISESEGEFSPYSNICPISGWTGAKVANISDIEKQTYFAGLLNGTYGFVDLGTLTWSRNSTYNVYYTGSSAIPRDVGRTNILCSSIKYTLVDKPYTELANKQISGERKTQGINIKDDDYSDADTFKTAMSGVYLIYELATPTTPTITQEQYNILLQSFNLGGWLVPVSWQSSAGTVYGGTLTMNQDGSGTLVVDRKRIEFDGATDGKKVTQVGSRSGSEPYNFYMPLSDGYLFGATSGMWVSTDAMLSHGMKYSHAIVKSDNQNIYKLSCYVGGNGTVLQPRLFFPLDKGIDTVAKCNSWLAEQYTNGTPAQYIYPLATPVTYSLTPGQVKTMLGVNNIWAYTGDILSVTYPADTKLYIDKKFAELSAAITALGT